MIVPWVCTVKGCQYRRREPDGLSYLSHRDKRGNEHPMKKEQR